MNLVAADVGRLTFQMRSAEDRKSTRLNSSHVSNSYAVFCSKKKMGYFHSLQRQLCWPIVVFRPYSNANSAATLMGTGFHLCLSRPIPHSSAHGVLDSVRSSS